MSRVMEEILQFFEYAHLPPPLQDVSKPFAELAHSMLKFETRAEAWAAFAKLLAHAESLPSNHQQHRGISKLRTIEASYRDGLVHDLLFHLLLEAKDCAVRAVLYKEPQS